MSALASALPTRRSELVVRPLGERGRYVVKDPASGAYFQLGEQEHFLLTQLDGRQDAAAVCTAFQDRFGQPLGEEELDEFLALARTKGLLESAHGAARETGRPAAAAGQSVSRNPQFRQSLLYWRKSLVDPDRLFTWLAPKLWFFWTSGFVAFSAGSIALAAFLFWSGRADLVSTFYHSLRWETAVLVWLALFVVTMLHESAHGLTCKRYGGEVHEIGFLLMYFMPCFYCNVSDAWLFREKSKRLWVTFAGGYFELFLWALAVFVWRLTVPATLVNYVAFILLSVCGVQTLFNFNPLLKLDGYYLLSDWLEIPNLRQRSWDYVTGHVRWLLWGAARPARQERGGVLAAYGLVSWLYSLTFVSLMLWGFFQFLWSSWGWLGLGAVLLLAWASIGGLFRGFTGGEVRTMFLMRRKRTIAWLLLLVAVPPVMQLVKVEDRASGPFQVRPAVRAQLRAEVAGFLREVHFDEGDRISPAAVVARLEVPDLASRIAQKQAEIREAEAKLRLLEIGPRPEEVAEQESRVERMEKWRDLARQDLSRARQAYEEELFRLDRQIAQYTAEQTAASDAYQRAKELRKKGAIPPEQVQEAQRRFEVAEAILAQGQFQKRHRLALGTREAIAGLDAEAELARREKDLADAQSTLTLLKAGARPEEKDAQRALLDRLREELRHWQAQEPRLSVTTPVGGVITTPRLAEMVGHYLHEGDLICEVEEPSLLEVEIGLSEQAAAHVHVGQRVDLKARGLPFQTFQIAVERIAPLAVHDNAAAAGPAPRINGDTPGTVIVYGRLKNDAAELRSGMTGYARVYVGKRPLGAIALDRTLAWLRTEFWW
ncbi:MAG: efflux RND transporter periplasmic adaptor subunit [Planctomycetaceae bacterium]|nr:efflux RND transporter periplasmic adaptor subunit [Planctomycetaceae bacterium]